MMDPGNNNCIEYNYVHVYSTSMFLYLHSELALALPFYDGPLLLAINTQRPECHYIWSSLVPWEPAAMNKTATTTNSHRAYQQQKHRHHHQQQQQGKLLDTRRQNVQEVLLDIRWFPAQSARIQYHQSNGGSPYKPRQREGERDSTPDQSRLRVLNVRLTETEGVCVPAEKLLFDINKH